MPDVTLTVSENTFEAEVLKSELPVLLDMWAPWCGPCRIIAPFVATIADENLGKLKVGKLNIDDNMEIARKYNIESIPTLLLFKNGEPVERIVGVTPKTEIERIIKPYLTED